MQVVHARKADLAMIPIENSIASRVADLHNLLPNAGLWIVGEHFQRVEHCLVAVRGATLKTVKVVRNMCRRWRMRGFLRQRIAAEGSCDTAGAARTSPSSAIEDRRHRLVAGGQDLACRC